MNWLCSPPADRCDVLIVSEQPLWPLDQGYRVHGSQTARALAVLGARVRVASIQGADAPPPPWLAPMVVTWPEAAPEDVTAVLAGWAGPMLGLKRRVAEHQGVSLYRAAGLLPLVHRLRPRAVVALGPHGPILLHGLRAALPGVKRVWYAADELTWFQASCLRREPVTRWPSRARMLGVYGLLEGLFGPSLDAAIGVSPADTRLLGLLARPRRAVTIRNGVDLDYFAPPGDPMPAPRPRSVVFWGRMDFEPNADAVCWFADRVWPTLRQTHGDAALRIVGKYPTEAVRRLGARPGVTVVGAVPDIRPEAWGAAVTVLPMRCGGGIKNKLLEAAAMGRPIVASGRAVAGLRLPQGDPPLWVCRTAGQWVESIARLWAAPHHAAGLGRAARRWVERNHTWSTAAEALLQLTQPAPPAGSATGLGPAALATTSQGPAASKPQGRPVPDCRRAA